MMSNAGLGTCQFCSKEDVVVASTSATDLYCKDCIKIAIKECREAIRKIAEYEKDNNIKKTKLKKSITIEKLAELERKKDEALAKLMSGTVYKR